MGGGGGEGSEIGALVLKGMYSLMKGDKNEKRITNYKEGYNNVLNRADI